MYVKTKSILARVLDINTAQASTLHGGSVIRALLVEKNKLWRRALSIVLSKEEDIEVAAELAHVDEAIGRTTPKTNVGIISIDPTSDHSNLTAVRMLTDSMPHCYMLVLTDRTVAGSIREALDSNYVHGFVTRDLEPDLLVTSIRQVAGGQRVVEPELAIAALHAKANPLTPRERDVLRMAMTGIPNNEIATCLHIVEGTVRNRMTSIINKTGARTRIEAIRIAQDAGWL